MNRDFFSTRRSVFYAALFLLAALTSSAGEEERAGQETPAQRAARLQAAFTEAVQTRDWRKLETMAAGLKAAGLRDIELEMAVLRAERDTALEGRNQAAQVITWGLSCRAMAGDPKALPELREMALSEPPSAVMPAQERWKDDREAANAAMKKYYAGLKAITLRDEACLCLALQGEPDVLPRAMACLTAQPTARGVWFGGGRGDPLIATVLLAEPRDGWKRLATLVCREEEAVPLQTRLSILQRLMSYLPSVRARWTRGRVDATSVDAEVSALLPDDAERQLLKCYASMLDRYAADTAEQASLNSLLMVAYTLPKQDAGAEVLTAIEGLKKRVVEAHPENQNLVRLIDGVLLRHKEHGAWPPAMEPPKVQAEF